MKKILYSMMGAALLLGTTACSDFLEQSSDSEVDKAFVVSGETTLRGALNDVYETWRARGLSHGNGSFYNYIVSSSDIELQPEAYGSQINRWVPSYFYGYVDATYTTRGTENIDPFGNGMYESTWTQFYEIIGKCNAIINSIEERDTYQDLISGDPTNLSQMYGEAICMRSTCYHELIRHFGDVALQLEAGKIATHLTNRDSITDRILQDLETVIPVMFRSGESSSIDKTYFNRTYAEGLVGRICLWAGGYQTRRTDMGDDFYRGLDGNVVSFEKVSESASRKCFYGRRSDWQKYYNLAEKYLGDAIANHGDVVFQTTDPRSGNRYGNPYQYVFQQTMQGWETVAYSDESVYEIPETHANANSERPYAFGRPSEGGSSNAFPCKTYDQARLSPLYYYNDFDPADLRRDVTCVVTGSNGKGAEQIISFDKGSRCKGGIALNKWDENRMTKPWTTKQRQSGINNPFMRFSDIILMQAEVKAALGKTAEARNYLDQIRNRAFGSAAAAKTDAFIAKCGSLLDACIEERKFEFGGEGSRKWDLIRTNKLGKTIAAFYQESTAMINDLKTKGYHEFENGNVISSYIWTKLVDAKSKYGYRLTTQCPAGQEDDPVLYPSWRGQNDDWAAVGTANGTSLKGLSAGDDTNLAIKGLFKYIDPDGAEAKALEADGYKKTDWGVGIVKNEDMYNRLVYNGYEEGQPPVYMLMMGGNVIKNSNGAFHNGYGFRDE
ncbi:MAG: RagB/SusD family nutrient uptake outer membrane protein [Prevotella sp.]|nr:RagB/SusD family nutrient uptake outer membrane protein [Prevotella sp.]